MRVGEEWQQRLAASGSTEKGIRSAGGGRRNKFQKFWMMVKSWHQLQWMLGKTVDADDIWLEFKSRVEHEIAILDIMDKKGNFGKAAKVWLHEMRDRLQKLEMSPK